MSNPTPAEKIEIRTARVAQAEAEVARLTEDLAQAKHELKLRRYRLEEAQVDAADETLTIEMTVVPSEVGQRVRFTSYGGSVRMWMAGAEGTVVRFTRKGTPVIELDHTVYPHVTHKYLVGGRAMVEVPTVSDVYSCAKRLDDDGKLLRVAMPMIEVERAAMRARLAR